MRFQSVSPNKIVLIKLKTYPRLTRWSDQTRFLNYNKPTNNVRHTSLINQHIYTVFQKKTWDLNYLSDQILAKLWPIFKVLSLIDSGENLPQNYHSLPTTSERCHYTTLEKIIFEKLHQPMHSNVFHKKTTTSIIYYLCAVRSKSSFYLETFLIFSYLRTVYAVLKLWRYSYAEQKTAFCTTSCKTITLKLRHCLQRMYATRTGHLVMPRLVSIHPVSKIICWPPHF